MSVILIDTTSYLKLSLGLHPILGRRVGVPPRECKVLSEVDREYQAKASLASTFYWLLEPRYVANRADNQLTAMSVGLSEVREWREHVASWAMLSRKAYKERSLTPPSPADALVVAYGIALSEKTGVRSAVVSDDGGVRYTVSELGYSDALSGWELVKLFHSAGLVTTDEVKAIYGHLQHLKELPYDWKSNSIAAFGF